MQRWIVELNGKKHLGGKAPPIYPSQGGANNVCGFVGIYGTTGLRPEEVRRLAQARELLVHRGPDDKGLWISPDRRCALGHTRLSILDLSPAGHQPMGNEDGTVQIVYNGEVYNCRELQADLERRGYIFRSRTDTEVLVHGYEEFGVDVVQRLRGMFSFMLYDLKRNVVVLARDRLGIKPLYVAQMPGRVVVASEMKAILACADVERAVDRQGLLEYLSFGKVYAPRTMFAGISKLPVAHYALIDATGRLEMTRYWSPYWNKIELPADADESFYAQRIRELLEESVRLRMLSDVPVGVFLSGGVDSTANVALMSKISGEKVHTFTAGFRGQEAYDERHWARKASNYFQTQHDEIEVTPRDLTDALPELSYYLDEPVADPTVIPIYFVSKLARQRGAIVILNGDGGDELFCGYRKYLQYLRLHPYWRLYSKFPPAFKQSVSALARTLQVPNAVVEIFDRSRRDVELYVGATSPLKGTDGVASSFGTNGSADVYKAVREGSRVFADEKMSNDYAEWLSYWGLRSEVEHVFLYRADRMGMANSVEIRVPFLDHHLVEFAMQMPQALKHKNGTTKYVLKKALKGIVPDEFLHRKKQGFCVPIREWAGKMMLENVLQNLPRLEKESEVLSHALVEDLKRRLRHGDSNGQLTWNLYALTTWYERWFAGSQKQCS